MATAEDSFIILGEEQSQTFPFWVMLVELTGCVGLIE